jgi:hypothetical protein
MKLLTGITATGAVGPSGPLYRVFVILVPWWNPTRSLLAAYIEEERSDSPIKTIFLFFFLNIKKIGPFTDVQERYCPTAEGQMAQALWIH